MPVVQGTLSARVFFEEDERRVSRTRKWLAAAISGAPKYSLCPVVIVVTDESGNEISRTSYGLISETLRQQVEAEFPS